MRFFLALLLVSASSIAQASVQFTVNANGLSSWFISSESANIGPTGTSNPNPTLALEIGTRYDVTNAAWPAHPFQLIAKGPNNLADTVLLSQGATTSSYETDAGINWTDNNSGLSSFTLTPFLVAAMTNPSLSEIPGYRCGVHTSTMRGNINVVPEPATACLLLIGGLSLSAYAFRWRKA